MKYIDEFRNRHLAKRLVARIKELTPKDEINFMEVCGTHTQSFYRFGINKLLPKNIQLISGPGCPVCVSPQEYIDAAIGLSRDKNIIIATFGDMFRIPGTKSSLEKERAEGANVYVVYSAYDSLALAKKYQDKKVVFLAVGFETTAPTIALSIIAAQKEGLRNLSFFSSLKLIPPAMEYLVKDKVGKLAGFLCPGHVSSIIGTRPYEFIPRIYKIPCCVAGFEPTDILETICLLLEQIKKMKPEVKNQYTRVVKKQGNIIAKKIINKVFEISKSSWRGLGLIPRSGLKIRREFCAYDAAKVFNDRLSTCNLQLAIRTQCRCADILKGLISPLECPLYKRVCTPDNPIGPCMVSIEGTCNAYYKYH